MIKNQLYPYVEEYINNYLYGFSKEQLDVGVMNGEIKLEKMNLRPDGINGKMDELNTPFWIKAGFISKINIGCSIMNFIGEKPLDVNIEDINVILTPSYKWILKNLNSFVIESESQIKEEYDDDENNAMNIFTKKVNIFDGSIFRKEKLPEIFKNDTKISKFINKIFKKCFKFYYTQNFALNVKIKNIHIRLEDDHLINYDGDFAIGLKLGQFDLVLSSEGIYKKDSFKISGLNYYWEDNAKILIPISYFFNSMKSGKIEQNYYTNINQLKFNQFNYKSDTKFILKDFQVSGHFGFRNISKKTGMDLFGKGEQQNKYRLYIQVGTNNLELTLFPDIFKMQNNLKHFTKDFSILEQVQEFKPLKKPYDSRNITFKNFIDFLNKTNSANIRNKFALKRKLITRDWIFYFFWCYKCNKSIFENKINPIRAEFSRFYNIYFNEYEVGLKKTDSKKKNLQVAENKELTKYSEDNQNPDNIDLSLSCDFIIKNAKININPYLCKANKIKNLNNDFFDINLNEISFRIILSNEIFDVNFNLKEMLIIPNKIKTGDKVIINKVYKKREQNNIMIDENEKSNYQINPPECNTVEDNIGLSGLVKRYNPNIKDKIKLIENVMTHLENNEIENSSSNFKEEYNDNINAVVISKASSNAIENLNNSNTTINYNSNTFRNKNLCFTKNIMSTFEASPIVQKMELNRHKNEYSISQAINQYNNTKPKNRIPNNFKRNMKNNFEGPVENSNNNIIYTNRVKRNITNVPKNEIVSTGKKEELNFIEIISNDENKAIEFKLTVSNESKIMDIINIQIGNIRVSLFNEYLSSFANLFTIYKNLIFDDISQKKDGLISTLKTEQMLFKMKNEIYKYLLKSEDKIKNPQIKEYKEYLQKEIEQNKHFLIETESYEINMIFNLFPKGLQILADYGAFECIYYNSNNKIVGKTLIPPPNLIFKLNNNLISFKMFEFDFEISEINYASSIISNIHNILEQKLYDSKLMLLPCLQKLKNSSENRKQVLYRTESKKVPTTHISKDMESTEKMEYSKNEKEYNNFNLNNYNPKNLLNENKIINANLNLNNLTEKEKNVNINNNKNCEKNICTNLLKESNETVKNLNMEDELSYNINEESNDKIQEPKQLYEIINYKSKIKSNIDKKEIKEDKRNIINNNIKTNSDNNNINNNTNSNIKANNSSHRKILRHQDKRNVEVFTATNQTIPLKNLNSFSNKKKVTKEKPRQLELVKGSDIFSNISNQKNTNERLKVNNHFSENVGDSKRSSTINNSLNRPKNNLLKLDHSGQNIKKLINEKQNKLKPTVSQNKTLLLKK